MGIGLVSLLLAAVLLGSDFFASGLPITVYVAPDGSDTASGSYEQPVKTFVRAQEIVRAQGEAGSKVLVRGGEYELTSTLAFTGSDSGASGQPNMWANFPGEAVTLYGSYRPTLTQVGPTTYTADLTGTPAQDATFEFLYRNGSRLTPARVPNWNTPNFNQRDPYLGSYFFAATDQAAVKNVLKYRPEDAAAINVLAGQSGFSIYIDSHEGLWFWRYKRTVTAINTATRELTLDQDLPNTIIAGDQYWIEGSSALLSNNEFYVDPTTKLLTVQLATALAPGDRLSIPVLNDLVKTRASHFTWHGFRMSEYNSRAFTVDHTADRVTFRNNEVTNGKNGFSTEYWPATNLLVEGNHFHDLERGVAVGVFGGQFVKTLTSNGNTIRNNTVQNIDIYGGAVGTSILVDKEQVGVEVSGNTISRVSRHGIIFEGNDHKIVRNNISLWGQLRVDAAAINTGARTFVRQGTLVEGNYISKQGSYVQRGYADWELTNDAAAPNYNGIPIGIMLDDYARNITVRKNVVHNVNGACISNHGGAFNTYEGNYLVDCHTGVYSDEPNLSSPFWASIYTNAYNESQALAANGYNTETYTATYPNLGEVVASPGQGEAMVNVTFTKNLFVNNHYPHKVHRGNVTTFLATGNVVRNKPSRSFLVTYEAPNSGTYSDINLATWQGFGVDSNLVEVASAAPIFSSTETFTLAPGSAPALNGIEQVNISAAGAKLPPSPTPTVTAPSQISLAALPVEATLNATPYDYQIADGQYRLLHVGSGTATDLTGWQALPGLTASLPLSAPADKSVYKVCLRSRLDIIGSLNPEGGLWSAEGCTGEVTYLAATANSPAAPSEKPTTGSAVTSPARKPQVTANAVGGDPVTLSENPSLSLLIDKGVQTVADSIVEVADLPQTLESRSRVANGLRVGFGLLFVSILGSIVWYFARTRVRYH